MCQAFLAAVPCPGGHPESTLQPFLVRDPRRCKSPAAITLAVLKVTKCPNNSDSLSSAAGARCARYGLNTGEKKAGNRLVSRLPAFRICLLMNGVMTGRRCAPVASQHGRAHQVHPVHEVPESLSVGPFPCITFQHLAERGQDVRLAEHLPVEAVQPVPIMARPEV